MKRRWPGYVGILMVAVPVGALVAVAAIEMWEKAGQINVVDMVAAVLIVGVVMAWVLTAEWLIRRHL